MDTPIQVSLVVPCFSYAHYLKECLDSILSQTYPAHEIIVVSDGSPDIEDMKRVLADYPTVILVEKENGGLSSARNAGIKVATGNYIMCLDSDDKLVPGALEAHVGLIKDDMTIAQCGLMEFGERHVINIPAEASMRKILKSNTIYCNALYPRKAWVESGGYDESEIMRAGLEDWEYWIRLLALGYKVKTSDFIALRYRCHEGQMTQATTHPQWDKITAYMTEKHKELYQEYNLI